MGFIITYYNNFKIKILIYIVSELIIYIVFNVFINRVRFLRRYISGYSFIFLIIMYVFLNGG